MFFLFPCMSLSIDANFIEQVEKSFFLFSGWVCIRIGIFFLNICRIHKWSHLGLYFCCFIFFFMGRFFNCKFNFFNRIQSYSGIYFFWNVFWWFVFFPRVRGLRLENYLEIIWVHAESQHVLTSHGEALKKAVLRSIDSGLLRMTSFLISF